MSLALPEADLLNSEFCLLIDCYEYCNDSFNLFISKTKLANIQKRLFYVILSLPAKLIYVPVFIICSV